MVLYKEKDGEQLAIVKCTCGTHNIEIANFDKETKEFYISFYTDNFYSKQEGKFAKIKSKAKKIWNILKGKDYIVDYEICLDNTDLKDLISVLNKLEGGNENENSNISSTN